MRREEDTHEASAAATGYLFQCRCALFAGLRAIPDSPRLQLSVEKFDDVAFEANGEPALQAVLLGWCDSRRGTGRRV